MAEERISYRFSLDYENYADVIEMIEAVPKVFRGEYIANTLRLYKSSLSSGVIPVPTEIEKPASVLKAENNIEADEKLLDEGFLKKESNEGFQGISLVDAFRLNLKGRQLMILGLDIGYSYTKVYTTKDGQPLKTVFPTLVSRYIPEKSGGFGSETSPIKIGDSVYLVGDDVSNTMVGLSGYRVRSDFVGKPEYFALIGHVLDKVNEQVDTLVLGLPPELYETDRATILKRMLLATEFRNTNGDIIPTPLKVEYIPQGAGIFFSHVYWFSAKWTFNCDKIDKTSWRKSDEKREAQLHGRGQSRNPKEAFIGESSGI